MEPARRVFVRLSLPELAVLQFFWYSFLKKRHKASNLAGEDLNPVLSTTGAHRVLVSRPAFKAGVAYQKWAGWVRFPHAPARLFLNLLSTQPCPSPLAFGWQTLQILPSNWNIGFLNAHLHICRTLLYAIWLSLIRFPAKGIIGPRHSSELSYYHDLHACLCMLTLFYKKIILTRSCRDLFWSNRRSAFFKLTFSADSLGKSEI